MPKQSVLPKPILAAVMMEMEQQDLEEGKERGYHYKELMEQKKREADLRRQKLTAGGGGNPGNFVRPS